jgi:hypothetical protein
VKIAQSTPDLLVLTDAGAPIRAVGAVFAVIGAVFLFSALRSLNPWNGGLIAALVCIPIGLAMIILPGRVTAAFDRAGHTLIVTRRSVRGSTRDEVDFSKISAVEAERSETKGDQPTFRVTVVLRDGYRLPLTSWYSNSGTHAVAAAAATTFLGLTALPPSVPVYATAPGEDVPALLVQRRTGGRFATVLAVLFLSAFVGVGGWLEYVQYSRLNTYRPAAAVVLTSTVISHKGSKGGTTWAPAVSYRYTVSDHEFVGMQVTPINESRSGKWAFKISARYHPGDATTAYYDPDRPDQAFLVHEASWFPLLFIGMPFAFLIVMLLVSRLRTSKKLTPLFAQALRK